MPDMVNETATNVGSPYHNYSDELGTVQTGCFGGWATWSAYSGGPNSEGVYIHSSSDKVLPDEIDSYL